MYCTKLICLHFNMSQFTYRSSSTVSFVVKNNSKKKIRIFNYPLEPGQSRDLMKIPNIGEEDIRSSLVKGQLQFMASIGQISVVSSDIDLTQYNDPQRNFLEGAGVSVGLGDGTQTSAGGIVDTINALSALPGPDSTEVKNIWIKETSAHYTFIAGDVTAVDNWTVVAPTGGTSGRWKLVENNIQISPIGGSADDWPRIFGTSGIASAISSSGTTLTFASQTFTVSSGLLSVPSQSWIKFSPKTTLVSTLTNLGVFPGNYFFHADAPSTLQAAGSLASSPLIGTTTLSVSITTKPIVGHYLQLTHGVSAAVYKVKAASGGSSPWSITIDRPTNIGWTSGDTVDEYASRPTDLVFDGAGTITGGSDQTFQIVRSKHIRISNMTIIPDGGLPVGGIGFDLGCEDVLVENCYVDFTGSGGSVGFQTYFAQSTERCTFRRCYSKNAFIAGVEVLDCVGARIEDCFVDGGSLGLTISSFGVGPDTKNSYGSFDCQIIGGVAVNCNVGAWIAGVGPSYNCSIEDFAALSCFNEGIIVGGGAVATRVINCDVKGSNIGLLIQSGATDTKVFGLRADGCLSAAVGCSSDLDMTGFVSTVNYAGNGIIDLSAGSVWRIRSMDITQQNAGGYGVYVLAPGRLELDGAIIGGSSIVGIFINISGATVVVKNTKITSDQGIFVGAGSTLILGEGLDLSGCTVGSWFTGTGTVKGSAFAGLSTFAMTTADHTATWTEFAAGTLIITGSLGSGRNLVLPKISVPWVVKNTADQTVTVKGSSGSGVAITSGSTARVIFDGTNFVSA